MKTFKTSGTGSGQSLSEIESERIPVYQTVADAEADLANLEEGQIVMTPDEGAEELLHPVDVVEKDNTHAVQSGAVANALSYSTTEQRTGGTWIDGKPIYRKVFTNVNFPRNTVWNTKLVDLADCSIDTCVDLRYQGTWNPETTNNCTGPIYSWFQLVYNKNTKAIGGNIGPSGAGYDYIAKHIIIEYTKTTD